LAAHTTGMPSGTTIVEPRSAASIAGSSRATIRACTGAAQT
jgi:hypothetical protein